MVQPPVLITRSDIRAALGWEALKGATLQGLLTSVEAVASASISTQVLYDSGSLHLKSAAYDEAHTLSVKANLRPFAGGVSGVILAYDLESERLAAILEGGYLTAARTAALAAIAAEALHPKVPLTLAMVGVGPVGRETLAALLRTQEVVEVRLWSRSKDSVALARAGLGLETPAYEASSPTDAVRGASLIVTSTPSSVGVLDDVSVEAGSVILAMGADSIGKRELGEGILARADLVADVVDDARRVGELAYLGAERVSEIRTLSDIVRSGMPPSRDHPLIVFDSVGCSFVDAAVVALVLKYAQLHSLGSAIDLAR